MTDLALIFGQDAEGRAVAEPESRDGTQATCHALAAFLTEEVRWPHYAALLLDQATEARTAAAGEAATGNAYSLSFSTTEVVIEHLHLPDQPPIHLPLESFIEVLSGWFNHLAETDRATHG